MVAWEGESFLSGMRKLLVLWDVFMILIVVMAPRRTHVKLCSKYVPFILVNYIRLFFKIKSGDLAPRITQSGTGGVIQKGQPSGAALWAQESAGRPRAERGRR